MSVVGTNDWNELAARVARTDDAVELLAVLGTYLRLNQQRLRGALPGDDVALLREIDPYDEQTTLASVEALKTTLGEDEAATAIVHAAYGLDRQHSRSPEFFSGAHWGPYPPIAGSDELLLLKWPRQVQLPVDRQSLVSRVLANHRVLARGPGGLAWDVDHLGGGLAPPRQALLRSQLSEPSWPLRIGIWPGSVLPKEDVRRIDDRCVIVAADGEEAVRAVADVETAIRWAEQERVHVLLLPELYLPVEHLATLEHFLDGEHQGEWPALIVVGLEHSACDDRWCNEAIGLDSRGTEIWRYRKVWPFTAADGFGECLKPGSSAMLRYTPAGWLALQICLDMFADDSRAAILEAAPALLLGPSLSEKTSPHLNVARELKARGTVMAVANRRFDMANAEGQSMYVTPDGEWTFVDPHVGTWSPVG